MPADSPTDWIALSLLPGLGPVLQQRALNRYGSPGEVAYRAPPAALARLGRCPADLHERIAQARGGLRRQAERLLGRCERARIRVVPNTDPAFPAALGEIPAPPVLLFVRGIPEALSDPVARIAVVGSRTPTPYGRRIAAGLGAGLAARDIQVVSGGALGIDTLAHRGALEEGGRTIAVLGSGLLIPYPHENKGLFDSIAAQGALVSELAPEEPPRSSNFPRRNRLISGLAVAVVVVEAAERSGSLSTAGHALEQGREVLAVPGPVSSGRSSGCHALIQQGAKLVQNIEDIVEELSPIYRGAVGPAPDGDVPPQLSGLTPDEQILVGLLDPAVPVQLDELASQALIGVARLQTALFGLQLRGAVEQMPGRYYVLRPSSPVREP